MIEAQDWSLNPGRYVGVAPGKTHGEQEFKKKLEALQEELEALNNEAARLQSYIAQNTDELPLWFRSKALKGWMAPASASPGP